MSLSPAYQNSTAIMVSSQDATEHKMKSIASNLSNAGTKGFLSLVMNNVSHINKVEGGNPISFVKAGKTFVDTSPGAIKETHNTLDVAIQGKGFFQTLGGSYTRNGQFSINQEGLLITLSGDPVLGNGGAQISIPPDAKDITISGDGTISSSSGILGQLGVLDFPPETQISPLGHGLYKIDGTGTPSDSARFIQGSIEESNVDTVGQLTALIQVQRFYEAIQKSMDAEHERLSKMMNLSVSAA